MRYVWGRDQARIKVCYGCYGMDKLDVEGLRSSAMPSFYKYVDRLRASDRYKFYKLQSEAIPLDTYVPGIGYKVKHKYSDDIVYVIDGAPWGAGKKEIDTTRERAWIARRNAAVWGFTKPDIAWYLRSRSASASECYVDRLTKKQKEAMMFIRMMDKYGFVEGVGGRGVTKYWDENGFVDHIVFVLDC